MALMVEKGIAAVLVVSVGRPVGIVSAKDYGHLPVMDQDRLAGIVTIGDMARSMIAEQALTIDHLHGYMGQKYSVSCRTRPSDRPNSPR